MPSSLGVVASGYKTGVDPYSDRVDALSPSVYFICDQTGIENPVDSSGGGRSAALSTPYTWGITGPVSANTALDITGGGFFTVSSRLALTGDQTRSGWVKTSSTDSTSSYDGDPACVLMGDSTGGVWDGFGITNGYLEWRRFNNSTWQTFTGSTAINDGSWHHIAMTYNSSTGAVVLYVDGASDGGGTVTAHQAQGGIDRVGRGYAANYFDGAVAHLAAWGSVLSGSTIADLANPG